MPVTSDQITQISRATVDLYRAAEGAILREVTRQLAAGMDAPDWAVTRLGAVSTLRRAVDSVLQLVLAKAAEGIRAALARAYRGGQAEATAGVPARLLPRDPDAVRAAGIIAEQLPRAGVIENLAVALVQDVGARHSNVVRHVTDVYRQVIAEATAVSVAGGMTRRQAAQHAYQKLVDQGLTSFADVRGRRWRLSSYVEMGVRTVTQRAAVQGQIDRQARLGLPFVVVSNEAGECVLCRPFEGRVLRHDVGPIGSVRPTSPTSGQPVTVDVVATLDEARAQGFQHPNCRHSVRAYLPGVTRLPEQPTADPAGDEARQRQRAIERAIRKYKERELGALTPEGKAAARAKRRVWQGQLRDHLAANQVLKRLSYREQIGAGNIPAGAKSQAAPAKRTAPPTSVPAPNLAPAQPQPVQQSTRATAVDRLDEFAADINADRAAFDARARRAPSAHYDLHLQDLGARQGFDALPRVGTRSDVDTAVRAGWIETWRGVVDSESGVTAAQINTILRTGGYEPGRGDYGNGYYVSERRMTAETFRGREPKTNLPAGGGPDFDLSDIEGEEQPDSLLRIAIDPAARLIDYDDLLIEQKRWLASRPSDSPAAVVFADPGRFAAARGYDVVRISGKHPDGAFYPGWEDADDDMGGAVQYAVLNRSVLIIQRVEDTP